MAHPKRKKAVVQTHEPSGRRTRSVERNWNAVLYSIIGLACLICVYAVHWMFIAPAAFFSWMGWKELFGKAK